MQKIAENLRRFRLITFDITDTLLTFKADPVIVYKKKAEEFGFTNIEEDELRKCFRIQFKQMTKKYPNFGSQIDCMRWEQWWILLVKNTFCCVNPNIDRKRLSNLAEHLLKVFRTSEGWRHIDCGTGLVKRMKEIGKHVGVISNFDSGLDVVLREMQILHLFDFVLTSHDTGIQKPERGIFDLAIKKIDAKPGEALHIGNSFDLDYMGAINAGWSSLLVTKDQQKFGDIKDEYIYSNICDMLEALETKEIEF